MLPGAATPGLVLFEDSLFEQTARSCRAKSYILNSKNTYINVALQLQKRAQRFVRFDDVALLLPLLATSCGAGLFNSSLSFTFCTIAVRAAISFCSARCCRQTPSVDQPALPQSLSIVVQSLLLPEKRGPDTIDYGKIPTWETPLIAPQEWAMKSSNLLILAGTCIADLVSFSSSRTRRPKSVFSSLAYSAPAEL